ncbi:MAG: histidinol-phosphatase [Alphaproteobacteria bacterium]
MTLITEIESELMAFADLLANAAADAALPLFRNLPSVENKAAPGDFDPVTAADKAAETAMRTLITATYPDHGIIGEEHADVASQNGLNWVLDPIDGTRAFVAGMPVWGTLIALGDDQGPQIGIIAQPYIGERWAAGPSGGSFTDRSGTRPLTTSGCTQLDQATVMATHPAIFAGPGEWDSFQSVDAACQQVRWGGDCYQYGLLALGTVDLVVESSLQPFDVQALIPVVRAAGGVITNWSGDDASQGGQIIAAATPELHAAALKLLAPAAIG